MKLRFSFTSFFTKKYTRDTLADIIDDASSVNSFGDDLDELGKLQKQLKLTIGVNEWLMKALLDKGVITEDNIKGLIGGITEIDYDSWTMHIDGKTSTQII